MTRPDPSLQGLARAGRIRLVVVAAPEFAGALDGALGGGMVRAVEGMLEAVREAGMAESSGTTAVVLVGSALKFAEAELLMFAVRRVAPRAIVLVERGSGERPAAASGQFDAGEPVCAVIERLEVFWLLSGLGAGGEGEGG